VAPLISFPSTTVGSLPKIETKMNRKIRGRATVKKTPAGSRQKARWS
jgi:hypothetical protein